MTPWDLDRLTDADFAAMVRMMQREASEVAAAQRQAQRARR
jgi:hypothetical protein